MKTPKIIPRGSQILVKPDPEKDRKSKSGLLTPDNVEQERKAYGEVIAVGPKIQDVKPGDRVVYGVYAGENISFGDDEKKVDYKLFFDQKVLAILK